MYELPEKIALENAANLVNKWIHGNNRSTELLVRQVAEAMLTTADEATNAASTNTINTILARADEVQTADGLSTVYLSSVAAERRLANMYQFLYNIDNFMLMVCTQLNQFMEQPETLTPENLTALRNQVMLSEEAIRKSLEQLAPKP